MSKITEQVTKALQTIEIARKDLQQAYAKASALESMAIDQAMFDLCDARNKTARLLGAITGKEE